MSRSSAGAAARASGARGGCHPLGSGLRLHAVLPSLAVTALVFVASCARPHPPVLLPAVGRAEKYLREVSRSCSELRDFQVKGHLLVRPAGWQGTWVVEAEHRVLYKAPDRFRWHVRYGGILGIGPVEGDLLARGDSLYLSISPWIPMWRGLASDLAVRWPREGPLLLATLNELSLGGPAGCEGELETLGPEPLAGVSASSSGSGEVALAYRGVAFRRVLWLDGEARLPLRSQVYNADEELVAKATYGEFRQLAALTCPCRIELEYPRQEAIVSVRHEEQIVNSGVADSLFEPGAEAGLMGGGG